MSCARRYLDRRNEQGHRQHNMQQRGPPPASFVSSRPHNTLSYQHDKSGHGTGGGIESLPDNLQQCARQAISRHHPILTETTFDEGIDPYPPAFFIVARSLACARSEVKHLHPSPVYPAHSIRRCWLYQEVTPRRRLVRL